MDRNWTHNLRKVLSKPSALKVKEKKSRKIWEKIKLSNDEENCTDDGETKRLDWPSLRSQKREGVGVWVRDE